MGGHTFPVQMKFPPPKKRISFVFLPTLFSVTFFEALRLLPLFPPPSFCLLSSYSLNHFSFFLLHLFSSLLPAPPQKKLAAGCQPQRQPDRCLELPVSIRAEPGRWQGGKREGGTFHPLGSGSGGGWRGRSLEGGCHCPCRTVLGGQVQRSSCLTCLQGTGSI